jgi:hypothetical protein
MDEIEEIRKIIEILRPEFDTIHPGFANMKELQVEWDKSRVANYDLHPQLAALYLTANGICRVKEDTDDALSCEPLNYLMDFMLYMGWESEDVEEREMVIPGSKGEDWVTFWSEGLYGMYLINLRKESPHYGKIEGVVNNLSDVFKVWGSIIEFLEAVVQYCNLRPLARYKENYGGSSPTFGYVDEKHYET